MRPYQVRYAYDCHQEVAKAAIHSRHEHIDDAAREFIRLTAPLKQVVVEEDGELEWLDDLEEARLRSICDRAGYDVEELDGGAPSV